MDFIYLFIVTALIYSLVGCVKILQSPILLKNVSSCRFPAVSYNMNSVIPNNIHTEETWAIKVFIML